MPVKHFVVNESINAISKEEVAEIELNKFSRYSKQQQTKDSNNRKLKDAECNLKYTQGRVIIKVDTESKNWHTFQDGTTIRRERQFNDFNKRQTQPVNAYVVSAENIPPGSEILIHHNSVHDTNRIFDYTSVSGVVEASDIKYYSIPENECYAWRNDKGDFQPMKNFCFALRVYEPYKGLITGIEPTIVKDVLYITSGELCGNICHVLTASDYTIIYQEKDGREGQIIRCRHFENDYDDREEVVAISNYLTDKLNKGELLVGISTTDAKKLNP